MKKIRIGILTIHDSPNYGACLQCYALWKYLTDQGYDCEVIDLHRPGAHSDYLPSRKYQRCRPVQEGKLGKLKQTLKAFFKKNPPIIKHYSDDSERKFKDFNALLKLSKPYRSVDELYQNPPDYDIYIAGSDQLWNPAQPYCLEPYFLTFVDGMFKKKVSFSTSIGITELTILEKNKFKTWLSDFSAISVREKQAKQLLESFIEREVHQVLDPTFLLTPSSWRTLAREPQVQEPYILYFALHLDTNLLNYCQRLSKESGSCLYVLNQTQPDPLDDSYVAVKDAGPREFIGYIANAQMVITDSFHGTVFSIIMGTKNFYTYIAQGNKRGCRIEDLLNIFELSEHLLNPSLSQSFDELNSHIINHNHVVSIMNAKRSESYDYIMKKMID